MTKIKLPFAVDLTGNIVSVMDVENGLACNCTCPACKARLIAKQSDAGRAWHFAHYSTVACKGGYESAMHLAVKKVIEDEKRLMLPACSVLRYHEDAVDYSFPQKDLCIGPYKYTTATAEELENMSQDINDDIGCCHLPSKLIAFDSVIAEQNEGNIRPDLIGIVGGKRIYIEVAVTHFIDREKLLKIRERNVPTIEITVDPTALQIDWQVLRQIVVDNTEGKAWKHNPRAEQIADENRRKRVVEAAKKQQRLEAFQEWKRERDHVMTQMIAFSRQRVGSFGTKIIVRLCPSHVSLSSEPYDKGFAEIIKTIAFRFHGKFNGERYQYEFPANKENYISVASAVKGTGLALVSWKDGDDANAMMNRIGY